MAEVVDRGALCVDSRLERLDHRISEGSQLGPPQRSDWPQRMDACAEQGLVGVDVPHARDTFLVEQEGLDRRPAPAGERPQRLGGEVWIQRLDAQSSIEIRVARLRPQEHHTSPEPPHVDEQEPLSVVQRQAGPQVWTLVIVHEQECSGHAHVHREVHIAFELQHQVLPAPAYALDPPSPHSVLERDRLRRFTPARVEHG